jgi:NTE family protein
MNPETRIPRKTFINTLRLFFKKFQHYLPLPAHKKIGLALGSGAARGLAHVGVIRVLNEMGVRIDAVSGCSIGALVGAFLAADRLDDLNEHLSVLTMREQLRYVDLLFPKSGLVEGRRIERFLREHLGDDTNIEDLPIKFACVATDFKTGTEVIFKEGDLTGAVRASISIPGIFQPVPMNDMLLVDGGVVNPVPVQVVRDLGADFIIAVDVSPKVPEHDREINIRYGYAERPDTEDIPNIFEIIQGSINIMSSEINRMRLKRERPDVLITPDLDYFGLFDFHRYFLGVKEGERAAFEEMGRIERFIKRKKRFSFGKE